MHITQLVAENVKRLKAINITPDGNLVVISGRNAQGKTSVLDAIWLAIRGADAGKVTPDPIRHGETEARVEVHFGDLVVTRTWAAAKASKIEVRDAGTKKRSPQKLLDSLVGKLSFDPLAFANMGEKEQRKTLLGLVDLPFDPEELDARRQDAFDKRTGINRDVKRLEAQLTGMPEPEQDTPAEEVSVGDLIEEHQKAVKAVAWNARIESDVAHASECVEQAIRDLSDAREGQAEALAHQVKLPKDLTDPDAIKLRIDNAESINAKVRADAQREQVAKQLAKAKAASKSMDDAIVAVDKERTDGLKKAKMPIEGLGFTSSGVTYQGAPFVQCSGAEKLRTSTAIAMAANPTMRVIRIQDGSSLDSDGLALLKSMAEEHDYQVWIERVTDGGADGPGVVIEDGMVAVAVGDGDDSTDDELF